MMRHRYFLPTPTERRLSEELARTKASLELLMKDCSGAQAIKSHSVSIAKLEAKLRANDKTLKRLTAENANLKADRKRDKDKIALQKKEISALRWDVSVAHSFGREVERKLKKSEKRRYKWAVFARSVVNDLCDVRAELRACKVKLNRSSLNSSLPPSVSVVKRIHNSRVKTDRLPGGQPGHPGHGRKQFVPDETVVIGSAETCPECGDELIAEKPTSRCITDLVITLKTTEFVAQKSICTNCGNKIAAPFPAHVVNEQNYGNNIRAVSTYLINRCNTSAENAVNFLFEATNQQLKLSTGSVRNFLNDFSNKAHASIKDIESSIKASPVIGSDATHTSTSGKQTYVYTFNSPESVVYKASETKGIKPLKDSPIAGYAGTITHDHDKSFYHFGSAHSECNAHILRALKGVCENEPEKTWASLMISLLCEANESVKKAKTEGADLLDSEKISLIESCYKRIIERAKSEYERGQPIHPKYKPEGIALYKRLEKYRMNHLAFIYDFAIPFDNNNSERNLRRVKMKTKQSGGFRFVERGQAPYCDFLSVTQTASIRGMSVFKTVRAVFDGKSDLFKTPSATDP